MNIVEIKFRYVVEDEDGKPILIEDPYDVYLTLDGELYSVDHDKIEAELLV
ncbi:hypothetical protein [Heyndrickxia acidiproducens]|uniref:hypothetical protein n=1 Tax=Heyndrickxia acidiproducens TaxID=1121084 RepID=UPI00037EF918|nr:hypothetical protein [Heyndrickxia acidiproducens]